MKAVIQRVSKASVVVANKQISEIHHRMPLLLSVNEVFDYFDKEKSLFFKSNFISQLEEHLEFYQISKYVNNPLNNSNECIKPINLQ